MNLKTMLYMLLMFSTMSYAQNKPANDTGKEKSLAEKTHLSVGGGAGYQNQFRLIRGFAPTGKNDGMQLYSTTAVSHDDLGKLQFMYWTNIAKPFDADPKRSEYDLIVSYGNNLFADSTFGSLDASFAWNNFYIDGFKGFLREGELGLSWTSPDKKTSISASGFMDYTTLSGHGSGGRVVVSQAIDDVEDAPVLSLAAVINNHYTISTSGPEVMGLDANLHGTIVNHAWEHGSITLGIDARYFHSLNNHIESGFTISGNISVSFDGSVADIIRQNEKAFAKYLGE